MNLNQPTDVRWVALLVTLVIVADVSNGSDVRCVLFLLLILLPRSPRPLLLILAFVRLFAQPFVCIFEIRLTGGIGLYKCVYVVMSSLSSVWNEI